MISIKGIAGEDIGVGMTLMRSGADGKYYLASPRPNFSPQAGAAAEPLQKGQIIEWRDGLWRPVNK